MNTFIHMVQVFVYRVVGIQRGGKMAVIRFADVFTLYPNKGISDAIINFFIWYISYLLLWYEFDTVCHIQDNASSTSHCYDNQCIRLHCGYHQDLCRGKEKSFYCCKWPIRYRSASFVVSLLHTVSTNTSVIRHWSTFTFH